MQGTLFCICPLGICTYVFGVGVPALVRDVLLDRVKLGVDPAWQFWFACYCAKWWCYQCLEREKYKFFRVPQSRVFNTQKNWTDVI